MSPSLYGHFLFKKGTNMFFLEFSKMGTGTAGNPLSPSVPYKRMNSKWIINLNVKSKTGKLLEHIGVNIRELCLGNSFLDMAPKT